MGRPQVISRDLEILHELNNHIFFAVGIIRLSFQKISTETTHRLIECACVCVCMLAIISVIHSGFRKAEN